jgi:Anabaena sensory rhodopsin transducer
VLIDAFHAALENRVIAFNLALQGSSAAAPQETQGHMTMDAIGRKRWAIAEGHIPSQSSFTDRDLISHETACILNAGDGDALVALTI